MLNCVEQPPDVLQSVRTHSSTCTWLTFTRSSDCSCGESERGRREEMRETNMGITIIVSEDTRICISNVGGEGYTVIYIWTDKRLHKRCKTGRQGLIYINAFNILQLVFKGARRIVGHDRGIKMMHG